MTYILGYSNIAGRTSSLWKTSAQIETSTSRGCSGLEWHPENGGRENWKRHEWSDQEATEEGGEIPSASGE